jgi:hypothetical protein
MFRRCDLAGHTNTVASATGFTRRLRHRRPRWPIAQMTADEASEIFADLATLLATCDDGVRAQQVGAGR